MLLVFFVVREPLRAATLVDPAHRYRTIETEHFFIYFHQGEEATAERLAGIAEQTWQRLRRPLGTTPPRRTNVILADEAELSNGFATPVPYDTVYVTAVWPAGSDFIGNTDDWLQLVFTHEFTHIVHLDRSEGWARMLRGVFGRTPYVFPNLFLPVWQIEGLATYEESAITGEGRLHAGDFRSVVSQAAREGRLEPLDRVNGGLTDWPGGNAAYAYGLGFHAYLADVYGDAKFGALADATARRFPYTASRVFKRVYGRSLGELWADYEKHAAERAAAPTTARGPTPVRVTRDGFVVSGPRFDPVGCNGCAPSIVYSVRTPHDFPSMNEVTLDGSSERRLTRRYLGSTAAIARDTIYFDQQEIRRNVGVYSDLYALDRATGRVRQLTSEARLIDPDLSPDGRTLVCVRDAPGRRDLVLIETADLKVRATSAVVQALRPAVATPAVAVLISEPETQFNGPRWSPDGRSIAVERHRPGHLPEVVIVDVTTHEVRVVAADRHARLVTPAWRPDGGAVVAAADLDDGPFNLYEFALDGSRVRQLTYVTGGATWPDISSDGKTIVFAGYTADGFDVFTVPYPSPEPGDDVPELESPAPAAAPAGTGAPVGGIQPVRAAYSPWPTLAPTSWSPVVDTSNNAVRVGAGVSGYDALQYHVYAVAATWLVSPPAGIEASGSVAPDWSASYAYNRWRIVPFAAASEQTSFFAGPASSRGAPTAITASERQIEAGVALPFVHTRSSHAIQASIVRLVDDYSLASGEVSVNRSALHASWTSTTAHVYGYSISPEDGITAGATTALVRRGIGALADATTATGDARLYAPGFAAHQVVALRAAGGVSSGDAAVRDTFLLGGAGPNASAADFAHDALSLLRGFPADAFAGTRVAIVNAEYRAPLARPERGAGTWPLFLHTLHGALFADAGHAWTSGFRLSDAKLSAGAELSANVVAGYFAPFTVTIGSAWGHDGSGTVKDGATVYARVGRAF